MILVYITCKNAKEAERISKYLISKKLAACTNIFPIKSMYRWKGRLCSEKETVLIAKTKNNKYNAIKREVKKIHSYEIPCIMKINVGINTEYGAWVNREVKR